MDKIDKRTKAYKDRKATEDALLKELEERGLSKMFYVDLVKEYMRYYDDMTKLNASYNIDTTEVKEYILREKRLILKEMIGILAFLGLKPSAEGGGGIEDL